MKTLFYCLFGIQPEWFAKVLDWAFVKYIWNFPILIITYLSVDQNSWRLGLYFLCMPSLFVMYVL